MTLKYEREKTAKTEELLIKDFEERLDYINKQWEKRMKIMNEEHKKEIVMLMQNQNRQIAKQQEDFENQKSSILQSNEENISSVKKQYNEKIKSLESQILDTQKENMQKLIDTKENSYKEAELMFEKQKQILINEMKIERDNIVKEILNKVVDEHMQIISKLKEDIRQKDDENYKFEQKIQKLQKDIENRDKIIADLKSTKPIILPKLDKEIMTDFIQNDDKINENFADKNILSNFVQIIPNKPKLLNFQINSFEMNLLKPEIKSPLKIQEKSIQTENDQNFEETQKCKILYMKMQNSINLSKALIDMLRGKLKFETVKYKNLCKSINEI